MSQRNLIKEDKAKVEVYNQNKFKCKNCGHKQLVPNFMKRNLCDWCGHWVFRNDKDEFEYRMQEKMIRAKKEK